MVFALETYSSTIECNKIISLFENDSRTQPGICGDNEYIPQQKKSLDLYCSFNEPEFEQYNELIFPVLRSKLDLFVEKYSFLKHIESWNISTAYNIQKYIDGDGYFTPHCEHSLHYSYRILAWMIYLNDAKCGTEFPYQQTTLQAVEGNVSIWSAAWTHVHKGVTPNVGTKYIVTGWCEYYKENN